MLDPNCTLRKILLGWITLSGVACIFPRAEKIADGTGGIGGAFATSSSESSASGGAGGDGGGGGRAMDCVGQTWRNASVGVNHSCAVTCSGDVYCWGANDQGQLGASPLTSTSIPTKVLSPNIEGHVRSVSLGFDFSCALLDANANTPRSVWCWGKNDRRQLGSDAQPVAHFVPIMVPGVTATQLVTAETHACALVDAGQVECWGTNKHHQSAPDSVENPVSPSVVRDVNATVFTGVKEIAVGGVPDSDDTGSTCFIDQSSQVLCWGANQNGEVGSNSSVDVDTPKVVMDLTTASPQTATHLSANQQTVAALDASHWLTGWGVFFMVNAPLLDNPKQAGDLAAASDSHACVAVGNTVLCRGKNALGELGNGTTGAPMGWGAPLGFDGSDVTLLTTHANHTCALTAKGALYCWGDNADGECGTDSATSPTVDSPRLIAIP